MLGGAGLGNGTADGTKLELYDCNGAGGGSGSPRGDGSLRIPQSGRCLDDSSGNTANGTALQLYDCNGNGAVVQLYDCLTIASFQPLARDQQWTLNSDQTIRTLGRCRELDGNGTANGTRLELYERNGNQAQVFTFN